MAFETRATVWALVAATLVGGGTPATAYDVDGDGSPTCKAGTVLVFVGESVGGFDPSGYLVFQANEQANVLAFDPQANRAVLYSDHMVGLGIPGRRLIEVVKDDDGSGSAASYRDLRLDSADYPKRARKYGLRPVVVIVRDSVLYWPECLPQKTIAEWKALVKMPSKQE